MVLSNTRANYEITAERLAELGRFGRGKCVSAYTPLVTAGPQTRQNEIRISNLIRDAEETFVQLGLRVEEGRRATGPVTELKAEFENPEGERFSGLSVFLSPDSHEFLVTLGPVPEKVFGGPRFITRYLLPFVDSPPVVHVLALSLGRAQLYEMGRNSESEVRPDDMPRSLQEIAAFEDPEKSLQHRGKDFSTQYHGHGAAKDSGEQLELDYIRQVARAVDARMESNRTPLLLACTDVIATEFRKQSGYRHVEGTSLTGNVEHLTPGQLRDRAWEAIDRTRLDDAKATEHFLALISSQQDGVVTGVAEVIQMAYQGRVSELLFPDTLQAFGTFNQDTGEAVAGRLPEGASTDIDDLVDLAALLTLQQGGTVKVVSQDKDEPEDLPHEAVAVLRS